MYQTQGLGYWQFGERGFVISQTPTCLTAEQKQEAIRACPDESQIRGLGAAGRAMSGRLSAFSACDLRDLPVCPTPRCIDRQTSDLIAGCIAGRPSSEIDCNSLHVYALSQLPLCERSTQPIPSCLEPELDSRLDYCRTYNDRGQVGPDKLQNAMCWVLGKDPAWWGQLKSRPVCAPGAAPTPLPPTPYGPDGGGGPDLSFPPTDDESSRMSMMGVGGILLLLAAAGGGYYLYRKRKG